MQSPFLVKICGLSTPEALDAALESHADMVGFVFFDRSPRNLALATARELGRRVESRAAKVALTVDADDERLAAVIEALGPDLLQLHGRETPERVSEVRLRFGLPVMKAVGIGGADDLSRVASYATVADKFLFDAKPRPDATRPGGNGFTFDWGLLADLAAGPAPPYLLSGGLSAENIGAALAQSGARGVDVSSGVETAPGRKDPQMIRAFIRAARQAAERVALGVRREPA